MTVKELIAALSAFPPEHTVVVAKDREGNGYSPAADLDAAHYTAETTWCGTIDHPDEPHPDGPNAVVIWPVN